MRYTVQNISHRQHPLDDHRIDFEYEIHFTEPETLVVSYFYSYSSLSRFVRDQHAEFYQYIRQVEKSIDCWGPKEHLLVQQIGEEALAQLYQCLEEYLLLADWIPKLYEQEKAIRGMSVQQQINTQQAAEKIVESLEDKQDDLQTAQQKYYKFCETVEKQIRQTAAEVYPELVDGDAVQLEEFRYLFVSDIQSMHQRIEKMLAKYSAKED